MGLCCLRHAVVGRTEDAFLNGAREDGASGMLIWLAGILVDEHAGVGIVVRSLGVGGHGSLWFAFSVLRRIEGSWLFMLGIGMPSLLWLRLTTIKC